MSASLGIAFQKNGSSVPSGWPLVSFPRDLSRCHHSLLPLKDAVCRSEMHTYFLSDLLYCQAPGPEGADMLLSLPDVIFPGAYPLAQKMMIQIVNEFLVFQNTEG